MATLFSKTLQPTNSTDAHFQGWISFIDRTLTGGGWVNTADTGQTAVASFVAPTGANEARGYRIYRMDDALHATYPVYLRLDFGSAGATANMGLWVTLGAASDGAGEIVAPWLHSPTSLGATIQAFTSGSALALPYSFGAAGTSWVTIAFGAEDGGGASGPYIVFGIERTTAPSGEPNEDGVLFLYGNSGPSLNRYQYLRYSDAVQEAADQLIARVEINQSPSAASDRVGVSVLFPWYRGLPQQPGLNFLIGRRGDWARDARISVEFYGEQHIYQALMSSTIVSSANTLPLMRYE